MAIGVNWAEVWDPVWKAVWAQAGSVVVPDVVGQTQASAITDIQAEGLSANSVSAYSKSVAAGMVISQSPGAGSTVSPGATVTITVSRGPSKAVGRNYIIKGKRYYNITNEELAYLISRDLIDVGRDEIKVTYKDKKPHRIPKTAWTSLQETLSKLESLTPKQDDDDDFLIL